MHRQRLIIDCMVCELKLENNLTNHPSLCHSVNYMRHCSALQSHKAVTAYLKSKQLLPLGFACQWCNDTLS